MNKDQFMKGLEAVDDELIAEAASTKSKGISYKTKMKVTRFVMGTAAAAVMVTTGVLVHMNSKKAPASESYAGAAVTEGQTKPSEQQTATERPTLKTYSITHGEDGLEISHGTATMLLPEDVSFDGKEFFDRMDNYSCKYDENIVNVQFNIASNFGTWINCGEEQADNILGELDKISKLGQEQAKGFYDFTSGVYNVNVEFKDGSSKIYTIPGGTIYQIQESDKCFQYELKNGSTEELYTYLNTTYSLLKDIIEEKLSNPEITTTTSDVTTSIEYSTLAKTTTRTGTATTETTAKTTTSRTVSDVTTTTTGPVPDEEREFIYNGDFYFPMANYHYAGDENIVNVKYSNAAIVSYHNAWINCSKNQADYILNSISSFELSDIVEDIGIDGGGFCVQIQYKDGTNKQYELFGWLGILYAKDTQGNVRRLKDVSGNADELTKYLQTEYMKISPWIDKTFSEIYG